MSVFSAPEGVVQFRLNFKMCQRERALMKGEAWLCLNFSHFYLLVDFFWKFVL